MRGIFGTFALIMLAVPLAATQPNAAPACGKTVPPGGLLAPWARPSTLTAATNSKDSALAVLQLGKAARLTLHPTPSVHYPRRPEKPGGTVSFGGLAQIRITEAGNYRVALGTAGWLDLVAEGQAMTSTGHGHGPECSGVRKMVDYRLQPGRYIVQIAANGAPRTTVLVVRLP